MNQESREVIAYRDPLLRYPVQSPFDPAVPFPEYPFGSAATSGENGVYEAVRNVLRAARLDEKNLDSEEWSPLRDLVQPGGTVLIKPNWVRHYHLRGEDVFSLITHPAVLRPLVDYAFQAVGRNGRIFLMDAPLFDTDFAEIRRVCQLDDFEATMRARGVPLTIGDLRYLSVRVDHGVVVERNYRTAWEAEGVGFDLGSESEMAELGPTLRHIFGSDYDRRVTASFHQLMPENRHRHCYRIARRALEADLIISVPKLKTHKKTGVTLNIKNMIGINTDKNYIPHYRVGSPSEGGDEYPNTSGALRRLRRKAVRHAVDVVLGRFAERGQRMAHVFMKSLLRLRRSSVEKKAGRKMDPIDIFYRTVQGDTRRTGNWWGNNTCWRSGLDINKVLLYGTTEGVLAETPQRRYFSVIDGILGGDGEGPLAPTPRPEGVLLAGWDPVSVDIVAAQVMGFPPERIRDLERARRLRRYRLTNEDLPIRVRSNHREWQGEIAPGSGLGFRAHDDWAEYLEVTNGRVPVL